MLKVELVGIQQVLIGIEVVEVGIEVEELKVVQKSYCLRLVESEEVGLLLMMFRIELVIRSNDIVKRDLF